MDYGAVLLSTINAFGIKTGVMVISLWLIHKLWRAVFQARPSSSWILVPPEHLPELGIIWWSLVIFFLAELACGTGFLLMNHPFGLYIDYLHSFFSALGMSLFAWGVYIYLDKKVFHYGHKTCLAHRICSGCTFEKPKGCKFRRLIVLASLLLLLASYYTHWFPTDRINIDPSRVALPFESLNAWYDRVMVPWLKAGFPSYRPAGDLFFIPEPVLFVEFRIIPELASIMLLAALIYLWRKKEIPAVKWLILALGPLAYAYFQAVLYRGTKDALLGALGHEITELWFLITLIYFLRRAFPPPVKDGQAHHG